jgi:hypothetical protein
MNNNLPVDIWRHSFELSLKENPLNIFNFTNEMLMLLAGYKQNEIESLLKKIIIENYKKEENEFIVFCIEENQSVLESKMFWDNIEVINSIKKRFIVYPCDDEPIRYCVKNNNFKLFDWLNSQNLINKNNVCFQAVTYKNYEFLRFVEKYNFPKSKGCIWAAVNKNDLEMIRFLRERNDPFPWDEDSTLQAAMNNNLEILKYLRSGNDPCKLNPSCARFAGENKNFEMLKFLGICETMEEFEKYVIENPIQIIILNEFEGEENEDDEDEDDDENENEDDGDENEDEDGDENENEDDDEENEDGEDEYKSDNDEESDEE